MLASAPVGTCDGDPLRPCGHGWPCPLCTLGPARRHGAGLRRSAGSLAQAYQAVTTGCRSPAARRHGREGRRGGWRGAEGLAAEYSNYGRTQVDVFAPGSDVNSAAPGNKYEAHSGTSFAAPVVSGIAALVMSYYPSLTAADVRKVILESATPLKDTVVAMPGEDRTIRFGELSVTGAVVNAYNALKLAAQIAANRTM